MTDIFEDIGSWLTLGLAVAALFGNRPAYVLFVVIGVIFMPVKAAVEGFAPTPCEMTPSFSLAIHSFQNYRHIVLFTFFTLITRAQFARDDRKRLLKVASIVLAMGAIVELEQGLTGRGHCRLRDLIPDVVGLCIGASITVAWDRIRQLWARPTGRHSP